MADLARCQSCGVSGMQEFCPACGERTLDASQRSLAVLVSHGLREAFAVDGKLWRTLRLFLIRPGFLSREHMLGVRNPYMRPLTLFLFFNLIYFLFSPLTDFTLPLDNQKYQPYGTWLQGVIDQYLVQAGRTFEEVAAQYDAVTEVVAKSLVIFSVPFLVPFAWLMNPSRKYYLVDHTVFALHLYCFVLAWPVLVNAVMGTLYYFLKDYVDLSVQGWSFLLIAFGPIVIYCIVAQRAMYRSIWWVALVKGWILSFGIVFSHFVYRFIQFWLVWWQVT
jgi:hypothetical protein